MTDYLNDVTATVGPHTLWARSRGYAHERSNTMTEQDFSRANPAPNDGIGPEIFTFGKTPLKVGYNEAAKRYEVYSRRSKKISHSYKGREKAMGAAKAELYKLGQNRKNRKAEAKAA